MAVALETSARAGGARLGRQRCRAAGAAAARRAASRPARSARRRATTRAPGAARAISRAAARPAGPPPITQTSTTSSRRGGGGRVRSRAACPSRPSRAPSSGTWRCRPGCPSSACGGPSRAGTASRRRPARRRRRWGTRSGARRPARRAPATMQARRLGRPSMRMRAGRAVPVEAEEARAGGGTWATAPACGCRRRTAPPRPARPRSAGTGVPSKSMVTGAPAGGTPANPRRVGFTRDTLTQGRDQPSVRAALPFAAAVGPKEPVGLR